jgi:hypothetical protein
LFKYRSLAIDPVKAGNGRPGSRARAETRAPKARGLSEGTKAQAGYRWQGEPQRVRFGGAPLRERRDKICQFSLLHLQLLVPGGDELRYFVVPEGRKAVEVRLFPWKLFVAYIATS